MTAKILTLKTNEPEPVIGSHGAHSYALLKFGDAVETLHDFGYSLQEITKLLNEFQGEFRAMRPEPALPDCMR